ncbi:hypothetical protein ACI6PS_15425 [Flavobacterium sp. PLA-1-15]
MRRKNRHGLYGFAVVFGWGVAGGDPFRHGGHAFVGMTRLGINNIN